MKAYAHHHQQSLQQPDVFWAEQAKAIDWVETPSRVLDSSQAPLYRWYPDGRMNTCFNALDRHLATRGEQTALIYDSPISGHSSRLSYRQLHAQVARLAGALQALGLNKGDRVVIYMPMVAESVVAMLACARLGAVHSVVFGGFAPRELALRIEHCQAKLVIAASCGLEPGRTIAYKPLLDEAIELSAHKPIGTLIFQRPQSVASLRSGYDHDWVSACEHASDAPCVPVAATDPLYILYTSGTTGQPKGVVRDNGGHAVAMCYSMKYIYNMTPGEVFWAASDVGWVVGHSYIVYAPLLYGCTTLVFEGKPVGTPDAGTFWRVISEHNVASLFTAPTAFRAIRREDPEGSLIQRYPMKSLRALFLAGERCDPATLLWAQEKLQVPVVDHWWQTETGWAVAANPLGLECFEVRPGSPTKAAPGWDVQALGDDAQPLPAGQAGALCCRLPLPPGSLLTLYQADERYVASYLSEFPGWYKTGDAGYVDEDGYVYVMARVDDVINVAGHRLSTGLMEEVIATHPDVAECAAIGVADELKGQLPLGLVCLKAGVRTDEATLAQQIASLIREKIGPVAAYRHTLVVKRLPKTRSGKILRGTMQKIADSVSFTTPATIDDPAIVDEIREALRRIGYARER